MANIQNDYTMNSYGEDEEERRRRRLEQEAAAAAAGKSSSIFDIPGQLLDRRLADVQNRMDNVSQFATDPEAAVRERLFNEKPTPVKQTITTDPETGAQTMKIEGSVQDLSAANPMTPTVSGPVVPAMGLGGAGKPGETAMGGTEPTPDQTEQQRRADGMRAMMSGAGTQVAGPVPAPAAAVPVAPAQTFAQNVAANQAAQPSLGAQPVAPTSVVPVNAVTQITPTGAAMVAAPAPAPSLAQAGAQATVDTTQSATPPVAAEPAWVAAANAAGGDLTKLFDVAVKHPEARVAIQEKMMSSMEGRNKEQEARKLVEAAQSGDPKAMNKLEQALRPDKGKQKEEVTVNDYLKAYMYKRLGLDELAADVQKKIIGKDSKFGQLSLGDSVWKTETNSQGEIIRAWDNENTPATKSTLAKLSAAGSSKDYDVVGGTFISDTLKDKNGVPLVGSVYRNKKNPDDQFVQTSEGKKSLTGFRPQNSGGSLSDMNNRQLQELRNKLDFAGPTASAEARERIIAESEAKFGPLAEEYKQQVRGAALRPAAAPPAAAAPAIAAPPAAAAPAIAAPVARPVTTVPNQVSSTGARPGGGGGVATGGGATPGQREANLATQQAAAAAEIQRKKEMQLALEKPAAAAAGVDAATTVKNQAFADRTYDLIKPINDAILKSTGSSIGAGVDTVAAAIGKSTEGSKAIARLNVLSYGILANIPRFEGPQSDIDVQMYKQAAGDFNNRKLPIEDRLAALDALNSILKRYDRAGKNDWTFGAGGAGGAASGTTSSGNKFKKVP